MPRSFLVLAFSLSVTTLAGCASRPVEHAVVSAVPPPIIAAPMPRPPSNAALGLILPQQLSDGQFATPNLGLSEAGAAWHLRAALNVAALGCADGTLAASYNRLLAKHRAALADAHRMLRLEYPTGDAFDASMTRLYNYFALPPAQAGYCRAAAAVLADAETWPEGALRHQAPVALTAIERPFSEFFRSYAAYRTDLARWQAGGEVPRLGYDIAVLLTSDNVTGDPTRVAAR